MSDSSTPKRQRSVINPIKVINELRSETGLPKLSSRAKTIKLTAEIKKWVTKQEVTRLLPQALTEKNFNLTEKQTKELLKEVEIRLVKIKSGKEILPENLAQTTVTKPVVAKVGPVSKTTSPKAPTTKKPATPKAATAPARPKGLAPTRIKNGKKTT